MHRKQSRGLGSSSPHEVKTLGMPTARRGQSSIDIAAPPDLAYDLITDVTRMGEWSPECYRCDWVDGVVAAIPGARFRGYNRRSVANRLAEAFRRHSSASSRPPKHQPDPNQIAFTVILATCLSSNASRPARFIGAHGWCSAKTTSVARTVAQASTAW